MTKILDDDDNFSRGMTYMYVFLCLSLSLSRALVFINPSEPTSSLIKEKTSKGGVFLAACIGSRLGTPSYCRLQRIHTGPYRSGMLINEAMDIDSNWVLLYSYYALSFGD